MDSWRRYQAGDIIDGKYTVEDRIGKGGYGVVYRVCGPDGRRYALKYSVEEAEDLDRFEREISSLERLDLPNVIKIVDHEVNHSPPYLVMPLAEGSLEERLKDYQDSEASLLAVFKNICKGVRGLHSQGLIHRDIKPSNILLLGGEVYVADLGLVRTAVRTSMGITTHAVGTPEYCAPEQLTTDGSRAADERTDIYQLGKVLYWLCTGLSPLHMDLTRVQEPLVAIIKKATQVEKEDRYPSVDCLLAVLEFYESTNKSTPPTVQDASIPGDDLNAAARKLCATLQTGEAGRSKFRAFWERLVAEIDAIGANFARDCHNRDLFHESIERTLPLHVAFAEVAGVAAAEGRAATAIELVKGFEDIIKGYYVSKRFSGAFNEAQFDYHKFVGHELFVTLMASFLRQRDWGLIRSMLDEHLVLDNMLADSMPLVNFQYISNHIVSLDPRYARNPTNRRSPHADLLYQRHAVGQLSASMPLDLFVETDYFLFIRSLGEERDDDPVPLNGWWPWSFLYLREPPRFLIEAMSRSFAEKLLLPLRLSDLESFRAVVTKARSMRMFDDPGYSNPLARFDPTRIGSR